MIFLLFVFCLFFLARITLVVVGLYKGPVLHSFEKYGDREKFYFPLVSLAIWLTAFILSVVSWVMQFRYVGFFSNPAFLFPAVGIVAPLLWYGYLILTRRAQEYPKFFMLYPHWYYDLRQRTTRTERRRLAYMWLTLPWRTRLLYNSSDRAFGIWVDLVILATLRPEADMPSGNESWMYD